MGAQGLEYLQGKMDGSITLYKEAFSLFDKDGDGQISEKDLKTVLVSLHPHDQPADEDIASLIKEVSTKQEKASIDYIEFVELLTEQKPQNELLQAFETLDTENTSKISEKELKYILSALPKKDAQLILQTAKIDPDGNINYRDLISSMNTPF